MALRQIRWIVLEKSKQLKCLKKVLPMIIGSQMSMYECISTNVYQISRGNHHSNKQKYPCLDDVITQEVSTLL